MGPLPWHRYVAKHDPVSIAQHFAARQKKTVRMIVVLFSAYAFSEGLDYKSLFSVNSDKNNRGRGEFMVKSRRSARPSPTVRAATASASSRSSQPCCVPSM